MSNLDLLEKVHHAVLAYSRKECDSLVRKVIYRLQRISASGIYGDDYVYRSLWDEFCHEAQNGPTLLLEDAWEQTIYPFIEDVIARVPYHQAVLISIFAAWELDDEQDTDLIGVLWQDGIRDVVQMLLREEAGSRNLEHLGPWRDFC